MTKGLTSTQTMVLELLKAGLSTGWIQHQTGAARSTISKCRRILRGLPAEESMEPQAVKKRLLKALEKQALKGGTGSVQAAKELLRQAYEEPPPMAGDQPVTVEQAIQLLREWALRDGRSTICQRCHTFAGEHLCPDDSHQTFNDGKIRKPGEPKYHQLVQSKEGNLPCQLNYQTPTVSSVTIAEKPSTASFSTVDDSSALTADSIASETTTEPKPA